MQSAILVYISSVLLPALNISVLCQNALTYRRNSFSALSNDSDFFKLIAFTASLLDTLNGRVIARVV